MGNKEILLKFISEQGYKRNSPDKNRPMNVIPSGRITMKDVDFPVHGVDNLGNEQVMFPEGEYQFPGDYVIETPIKQQGGNTEQLIPDTSFLNTDFKEWGDDEILKYYWLKKNYITDGNQDAENYFSGIMDNYDQANKRYQELQSENPDMSSEEIYSVLDEEGLSEWRNAKFDRSNYKDYSDPNTLSFYELDQQYDPQKYKGLQSRDEYKEYLQSDKYKDIAKKFWGKDAKEYTQKQLDDIDAAEYRSSKEANFQDIQESLRGNYANIHGFYNPIGNYIQMVDGDMSHIIPHETSHLTDRNENPLSDSEAYEYETKPGYFTNRVQRELSPEQLERLKMSSQFSKWQDLESEFDTQFDTNSQNLTEEQRLYKDYLTKPTEVRARVNAVRNELYKQGIDWNNIEDVNRFIQTLPEDNIIRQQYEQLNFLNEDTKNTLFNEYAYQESQGNDYLQTAQQGGEIKPYQAVDWEDYYNRRKLYNDSLISHMAFANPLELSNGLPEISKEEYDNIREKAYSKDYLEIRDGKVQKVVNPKQYIKSRESEWTNHHFGIYRDFEPESYKYYGSNETSPVEEGVSTTKIVDSDGNVLKTDIDKVYNDRYRYTKIPYYKKPVQKVLKPDGEPLEEKKVERDTYYYDGSEGPRGDFKSTVEPIQRKRENLDIQRKTMDLSEALSLEEPELEKEVYYRHSPSQFPNVQIRHYDDGSKTFVNADGQEVPYTYGQMPNFNKEFQYQQGGETEGQESNLMEGAYMNDFLFTDDDIRYANNNRDTYCPRNGDCLATAFMGYDAMVASRHGDFPSSHAMKEKLGFASLDSAMYEYDKENDKYFKIKDRNLLINEQGNFDQHLGYKPDGGVDWDKYEEVSPETDQWIRSQKAFHPEIDNYSVDSWDVHGQIVSAGGINLYNEDFSNRGDGWAGGAIAKMSDEERNDLYSKIPVGAIIGFGGDKYGNGYNADMGLPASRHSAVVVGFSEDGTPVIYDYGFYFRLDDNKFNKAVSNISYPKEFENKTKAGLELLGKFSEAPTKLNLNYDALIEQGADEDELGKFYETLRDKKLDLMNDLNINNADYDRMAKMLMAISMQESGGGSAFEHDMQSSLGTTIGDTQGLTQMNIKNILEDEQLAPIAEKYGITEEGDLFDPKKAAIASMIYAKRNMKSGMSNFQKGLFAEGQTGTRTYSPREGATEYWRDAFSAGTIPYDGYTFNTEEGKPVDFVTGNNSLRLGWDKDLEDIQAQFDAINDGRYKVYDDEDEDGNVTRRVDKTTYGNFPELTPEQIFAYNWQSPTTLSSGDAQGNSSYVKQILEYYNAIEQFQTGGTVPEEPKEDPILTQIYGDYPAMKNMGPVTIKADPNFTREFTGVGDIEYFKPDPEGRGTIIYPSGAEYAHPDSTKSSHGIVYNPNTNNAQSVFLDMLHGMTEADPKYRALRDNFKNAMLKAERYGFEADWNHYISEAGGEENTDGRAAFIENWTDGKIRNLLFEAETPEDWEKYRYWDKARETYLAIPELNQTFTALSNYLMTNQISDIPQFTLPEVTITPKKELLPGEKQLQEPLDPKFKQGGTTYSMTNDIKQAQKLLSLLN